MNFEMKGLRQEDRFFISRLISALFCKYALITLQEKQKANREKALQLMRTLSKECLSQSFGN